MTAKKKWDYCSVDICGDTDTDIWYCKMHEINQSNLRKYLSPEFSTNVKEEDLLCFHEKTKGKQEFAKRLLRFIESIGGMIPFSHHKKMSSVDYILNKMDEQMSNPRSYWHSGSELVLSFLFEYPVDIQKLDNFKYDCYLELYPSIQLNNFIKNKQEFLEVYQVGSDEFAYDHEDEITKAVKNIFGEDKIKTAIYDFGGDSDDFKILIELITHNEEEKEHLYYFMDRSNKFLPEGITVQDCLNMQNYNYNLVKELYNNYVSSQIEEV